MATKKNTTPTFVVTAKMTPQAKRRLAQRQRNAFNKARAAGHRYFYFDGDWYNTKKAGESDAYWGAHFKDNTTGAGASNVQTSVGGMWRGKQGVEGRYDDNGKWMTFSNNSNSGPVEARGNHHSNMRGYIKADLPTDNIVSTNGTNRGRSTTNTRTGITVGNKPQLTDEERQNYPRRNPAPTYRNMNWDAADFVDALMPINATLNLVSAATDSDYTPYVMRSGFNPFGYSKDAVEGSASGLLDRSIKAATVLGLPRALSSVSSFNSQMPNIGRYLQHGKWVARDALRNCKQAVQNIYQATPSRLLQHTQWLVRDAFRNGKQAMQDIYQTTTSSIPSRPMQHTQWLVRDAFRNGKQAAQNAYQTVVNSATEIAPSRPLQHLQWTARDTYRKGVRSFKDLLDDVDDGWYD